MAPRKSYSPAVKAKAVLELLRDDKPLVQVAAEYGVHPNQLRRWKQTVIEQLPELFSAESPRARQILAEEAALHE
jgi:putative transposase